jgi:FG-GAP-like repeat
MQGRSRAVQLFVVTASVLSIAAAGAAAFGTFKAPRDYDVGGNPLDLATADINRDGARDLATADDDGVSVLRGSADGTFKQALVFPVESPNFLVLARLDGDRNPDVVTVGGISPSEVAIGLGNGDGTFSPATPSDYALSEAYASSVAVGDFNRDGAADIATGTYPSSTAGELWILTGNGDGTFESPADYEVNTNIESIAVARFEGDRKPDLAIAPTSDCMVGALEGNGDGTFAAPVDHDAGDCPYAVIAGEFAGGPQADLATASLSSSSVSILRGRDGADFAAPAVHDVGDEPFGLVDGDFNRDGRIDLAATDRANDEVTQLRGKRRGGFRRGPDAETGDGPIPIIAGRLNGDAGLDLATGNQTGNDVSVLRNRP